MKSQLNNAATIVFAAATMFLTRPMMAQTAANSHSPASTGILGYLDTKTGAFRPATQGPVEDSTTSAAAITPSTGKFVFNFTITVSSSSIPSSQPIACEASASTSETNTTTYQSSIFEEEATAVATRSGSTATCSVTIPYSWGLATATSDTVQLSFIISTTATSSTSSAVASRLSSQTIGNIKVPSSGATTTEAVKVTI